MTRIGDQPLRSGSRPAPTVAPASSGTARREGRHGPVAQLLIAWAPLSLILLAYALAGWVNAPLGSGGTQATNRFGAGVHVNGPADLDRVLVPVVPTVWLQQRLLDGSAHWWDALAALVYATHFVSIPVVTGVVWFCLRDRFTAWMVAVVVFTAVGMGGYVLYPAAPPWLASEEGAIGPVHRISALGWGYLRLDWVGTLTAAGQDASSAVQAMPSLHAGAAVLVTLFLWPVLRGAARVGLCAYALLMCVVLVYTGEHYLADVLAGAVTAAVAVACGALARRHLARPGGARGSFPVS